MKRMVNRRYHITLGILALLVTGGIVQSVSMGYMAISWQAMAQTVWLYFHDQATIHPVLAAVIFDVRLPRVLASALVGGGLALCGVVFQAILLNPLADPYTLGVSSGAAFGAALAMVCGLSAHNLYAVPAMAFTGALLTLALVIYLSSSASEGISPHNLILSGIIVAAILAAGISFLKFLADEQVGIIIFWLMGSLAAKTWPEVLLLWVIDLLGFVIVLFHARDLNLMAMGARTAATMGVNPGRLNLILLITASLVAAVCVAIAGIIGFVGLLVPHIMRGVSGPDNRRLLPLSFLAGALLLLVADTVTRAVLPREIPIGVLTALIGGPFFCYIFRRRQRRIHDTAA